MVESAYFPTVTKSELWEALWVMAMTISPRTDGIRTSDLVRNFNSIKEILLHVINETLITCEILRA